MTTLSPPPKIQFFNSNGQPLVGGKLYTYAAGTTTPLATYQDNTGTTLNSNPVILNGRGEANIWLTGAAYKFRLTDANDVEIWTVDYISGSVSAVSPAFSGNVAITSDSAFPALKITQTGSGDVIRVQDSVDPDATPFVVNALGRVGIGTASPQHALDINDGILDFTSNGTIYTQFYADAVSSFIEVEGNRSLAVRTNDILRLTLNAQGAGFTVPVFVPGDPVFALEAAPKQYVDAAAFLATPPGVIAPFAGTSVPVGWVACDGASLIRTDYPRLFAAIGTTWGSAGATVFNVPDLRGMFLRGAGTNSTGGSAGAVGPAVGTYVADAYLNHGHTASSVVTDPQHSHSYTAGGASTTLLQGGGTPINQSAPFSATTSVESTGITVATTVANSTTGGTETRPKNYGILYIIKT
jgi:microcystin-dependent protein